MKERFVNEKLLVQNLPISLCGINDKTDEKLERIIDSVEERMILKKAQEIKDARDKILRNS